MSKTKKLFREMREDFYSQPDFLQLDAEKQALLDALKSQNEALKLEVLKLDLKINYPEENIDMILEEIQSLRDEIIAMEDALALKEVRIIGLEAELLLKEARLFDVENRDMSYEDDMGQKVADHDKRMLAIEKEHFVYETINEGTPEEEILTKIRVEELETLIIKELPKIKSLDDRITALEPEPEEPPL